MCEEVEAHALYEKSAALARAPGSRRLPKLRAPPSSLTGRALATQQSLSLHQLMAKQLSNAARSAEEPLVPAQNDNLPPSGQRDVAAAHLQLQDVARISNRHLMHTPQVGIGQQHQHHCQQQQQKQQQKQQQQQQEQQQQQQQQPVSIGREAQLLLAPYKAPPGNKSLDPPKEGVKHMHAKPAAADLGVAVVFEEKYHRAGREVLGQHVNTAAAALAAQERAKHHATADRKRMGYTSLRHEAEPLEYAIAVSRSKPLGTHMAASHCFQYASAI